MIFTQLEKMFLGQMSIIDAPAAYWIYKNIFCLYFLIHPMLQCRLVKADIP